MVERFLDYHARWRSQGVLAMLYRLLHDFEVPARLLQKVGGERELTDILHLAELLQTDSQHLDGELALVRSLSERIQVTTARMMPYRSAWRVMRDWFRS